MNFSNEAPEGKKIKIGKVINKVLPIAQQVLPVASVFVPALAPVAAAVGGINIRR